MTVLHFVVRQTLPSQFHVEGKSLLVTYDPDKKEVQLSTLLGERIDSIQVQDLVALLVSEDESVLLMLTQDGWVRALDLDEKGHTKSPMYNQDFAAPRREGASAVALSGDKTLMAIGFEKSVQLFQIRSEKVPRPLQVFEFNATVTSVRFTDDGLGLRVVTKSSVVVLHDNDD